MRKMMANQVTASDFERMFGYAPGNLPQWIAAELERLDTKYRPATESEIEEYVLDYLHLIDKPCIQRSREENLAAFEKGWNENYRRVMVEGFSEETLRPGYFRGSKYLRYCGGLVISENLQLEFDLFRIARKCIYDRYLNGASEILELGCGSCQNLLMLAKQYPYLKIRGADWTKASYNIAVEMAKVLKRDIRGYVCDISTMQGEHPELTPGELVVTIHAFEQLGIHFEKVLEFILSLSPRLIVQYEPVLDFYSPENLYDELALRYSHKRNYLKGYLGRLRELEKEGKVEIVDAYRPYLGGVLHESSMLVWRPK